jgi:hypothetical protein
MTQNLFTTIALVSWPLIAMWLYHARPLGQATLWTILGGQLLLPVGAAIKVAPGIPQFDKVSIPNLAALVGCLLVMRRPPRLWNGFGLIEVMLLMSLIGPFVTSELNGDLIFAGGGTVLPSVGHYDALSTVVFQFISIVPFFLGRQVLRTSSDIADALRMLVISWMFYSLLMLFEIRFSPQLHYFVYGYFPSGFDQAMRDNGFRPMVFMGHGLPAAFFTMMAVVAATALWRAKLRVLGLPTGAVTAYLGTILILCKSAAALIYAAALAPLVAWAKPRLQVRVAVLLVSIALLYPMLRIANLVPTGSILEVAETFSLDRANSLKTRFDQEQLLLAHASERFLFGWGRFSRSRVFDEGGRDISITDGRWIITLGQFGLFGFLAEFGLLALPVFRTFSTLKFAESKRDQVFLAALALILAVNTIDLLPNSGLMPWTWLLAGALLGRAEALRDNAHLYSGGSINIQTTPMALHKSKRSYSRSRSK